jgi:hypothetical protein
MSTAGRPVRISAAVMTHPARMDLALAIRRACPELGIKVVVDPAPDGPPSAVRTGIRAWGAVADWATHHLVLEDDAVLHPAFTEQLNTAVSTGPEGALCLFTEWGSRTSYALRLGACRGARWAPVIDAYVPCLAICLPAEHARALGGLAPDMTVPYDVLVHSYLRRVCVDAWVSIPNLADHGEVPSLVGNHAHGRRRSACFLPKRRPDAVTAPADLTAEWRVPCFSWQRGFPWCYVPDPDVPDGWHSARMSRVLSGHGKDVAAALRAGRQAAVEHGIAGDIQPGLADGLWLTAFGLGVELRAATQTSFAAAGRESVLTRIVPRAALATMPNGALRTLVSADKLRRNRGPLRNFVEEAVRQGAEE